MSFGLWQLQWHPVHTTQPIPPSLTVLALSGTVLLFGAPPPSSLPFPSIPSPSFPPFPLSLSGCLVCPTAGRRREAEETAALSRLPPFGEVASFCSQGKKQKMEGAKRKLDSANGNEPSLPDGNRTLESGDQPPSDGNVLGCMGAARRRRLSPKPPSSSSSSPSPSPEPRDSQVRNLDQ